MFVADKKYEGWKANQMVQGMVKSYKDTIAKLKQQVQDLRNSYNQGVEEQTYLEQEIRDKDSTIQLLQQMIDKSNKRGLVAENNYLKKENEGFKKEIDRLIRKVANFDERRQRAERLASEATHSCTQASHERDLALLELQKIMDRRERIKEDMRRKKEADDNFFVGKRTLDDMSLSDSVSVVIRELTTVDGDTYIDARKYYNGQPTQKGICLLPHDMRAFLNRISISMDRLKSRRFKEAYGGGKSKHTCKGCQGRF